MALTGSTCTFARETSLGNKGIHAGSPRRHQMELGRVPHHKCELVRSGLGGVELCEFAAGGAVCGEVEVDGRTPLRALPGARLRA